MVEEINIDQDRMIKEKIAELEMINTSQEGTIKRLETELIQASQLRLAPKIPAKITVSEVERIIEKTLEKTSSKNKNIGEIIKTFFPEGRILGISKKLTAVIVGIPINIITIIELVPLEIQPLAFVVAGIVLAIYLFVQTIIDV